MKKYAKFILFISNSYFYFWSIQSFYVFAVTVRCICLFLLCLVTIFIYSFRSCLLYAHNSKNYDSCWESTMSSPGTKNGKI